MALSEFDRNLVDRCLQKQPQAWEEFVDRFGGLISFIVRNTCKERSIVVDPSVQDDLVQEVFVAMLSNNFVVLRRFRGNSSLATYLTVIARRVIVKSLIEKHLPQHVQGETPSEVVETPVKIEEIPEPKAEAAEEYIENMDEILYLVSHLTERDAQVVKMYHLEQKSYAEISSALEIPENTVGPILSRAREVMRQKG